MKYYKYRIYFEDTDAQGLVYYANYLKFYERARTDFLRDLELWQSKLATESTLQFVVKKFNINYIAPAKFDDMIDVYVNIVKINNFSIEISQKIMIKNVVINDAYFKIACISSKNFKLKTIPQNIKKILSN